MPQDGKEGNEGKQGPLGEGGEYDGDAIAAAAKLGLKVNDSSNNKNQN
jgi:hypothetical protein